MLPLKPRSSLLNRLTSPLSKRVMFGPSLLKTEGSASVMVHL
jgi:hypothetical protein